MNGSSGNVFAQAFNRLANSGGGFSQMMADSRRMQFEVGMAHLQHQLGEQARDNQLQRDTYRDKRQAKQERKTIKLQGQQAIERDNNNAANQMAARTHEFGLNEQAKESDWNRSQKAERKKEKFQERRADQDAANARTAKTHDVNENLRQEQETRNMLASKEDKYKADVMRQELDRKAAMQEKESAANIELAKLRAQGEIEARQATTAREDKKAEREAAQAEAQRPLMEAMLNKMLNPDGDPAQMTSLGGGSQGRQTINRYGSKRAGGPRASKRLRDKARGKGK